MPEEALPFVGQHFFQKKAGVGIDRLGRDVRMLVVRNSLIPELWSNWLIFRRLDRRLSTGYGPVTIRYGPVTIRYGRVIIRYGRIVRALPMLWLRRVVAVMLVAVVAVLTSQLLCDKLYDLFESDLRRFLPAPVGQGRTGSF